ncbi:MAG: SulP family inorganic anion transporter [Anaerolineae bacterium]|nr:SulP family inorganic anion transporter [Anaerolineae bacterium]
MSAKTNPETTANPGGLGRFLPILSWLPKYDRSWLPLDIIAGLTLWGLVVPEAMAYAGIAGLPPQAGLYTLLAALLVYALLGTSRHLVVQATSATAALLASGVATALVATAAATASDPQTYQNYATAFVLVTGLVFLAAGLARLGFITQFLSKPVMDGFITGLAIFVVVGQLNKLFGVAKPDGNTVEKLMGILRELPQANWVTFAVGAVALALLFVLPRLNKKIPGGLVVLFGAIGLSAALDLNGKYGVEVVGALPQGLPSLTIPQVPFTTYLAMLLPAMGVLLVAYSEALGVAHEFAEKHGYEVNADQELNAHAGANLLSALFGGMLAAGSMSASAVKDGAGARSQVTNLVTWGVTIITVLFLTPLFTTLPEAVLAALIIHALWHILSARKVLKIRLASRVEFWFAALALAGVLLIDVLEGMIIGVVASLVFVIFKSSRPHVAALGHVPGVRGAYSDLGRHPENIAVPGVLIARMDGQLYYASAPTLRDQVKAMIEAMPSPPRAVILDANAWYEIDVTSVDILEKLLKELQGKGIAVYLADVHAPVYEYAARSGLLEIVGQTNVFPTVDAAVRYIETNRTDTNELSG